MSPRLPAAPAPRARLDTCAQVVDVEGFNTATFERIATGAVVTRTVLHQHVGTCRLL